MSISPSRPSPADRFDTPVGSSTFTLPLDLLESFGQGGQGVVAFVGSGPSCAAGLPSWSVLLQRVAAELCLERDVEQGLRRGRLMDVAQFLASRRSERDIQERVARQVRNPAISPSAIHDRIVHLPFEGIITTNYDLLLTDADYKRRYSLPMTWRTSALRENLKRRFVFHLHGHVDDPSTIVFTRAGYDHIVVEEPGVREFLSAVFHTRAILFVGFGFADPDVDGLLRDLGHVEGIDPRSVFALIPMPSDESPDAVTDQNLRFRLINPIYVRSGVDHGLVATVEWLDNLATVTARIRRSQERSLRRLKPVWIVKAIEQTLASDDYFPHVSEALELLEQRPDLDALTRGGLATGDIPALCDRLGVAEIRRVLIHVNSRRRHPMLEDVLSCLPPDVE